MRRLVYRIYDENNNIVDRDYSESKITEKLENIKKENPTAEYHVRYGWSHNESRF